MRTISVPREAVERAVATSRRRRSAFILSGLVLLSTCSSDQSAETTTSPNLSAPTTAPIMASAAFCARAIEAVDGQIAFNDPTQTSALIDDSSLDEWNRRRVSVALDDAARQVATGVWDNAQLVDLVNELCGTRLTPVTMMQ